MFLKILLIIFAHRVYCDDDYDIPGISTSLKASYKLLHSYDGVKWEERGIISIASHGDKRRKPTISIKNLNFNKNKLNQDGLYYVGMYKEEESTILIQSAIKSCNLFAADLLDSITLYLDLDKSQILAINYQAAITGCDYTTSAQMPQTSVEAGMVKEAMKPIFVMPKIEDPQEQQGFFRKYVRYK